MIRGRWALAWLLCTSVSVGAFARPKTTPIHPDEVYWIGSTYYWHLAFERFDWSHPDWRLQPARENPPVARYVIGLGLNLQGQHIVNRDMLACFHLMFIAPGAWGEGEDYAKRVAIVGDLKPENCRRALGGPGVSRPRALPYMARYVMLACAALTSLALFFFGASIANPATGLIASQLLLLHPYMIYAYNRTMSDPVALLFGTLAAFATWKWLSAPSFRSGRRLGSRPSATRLRLALLIAVLLALACGAKMNALIVVFLFGGAAVAAAMAAWRAGDLGRARLTLVAAAAVMVIALGVFIILNPAMLLDIQGGLVDVVREAQRNTAIQARVMFQDHLTTLPQKLTAVSQVAGGPIPFVIAAALSLFACVKARSRGLWFLAGWWTIAVFCVTAWIPFDWSRYVLPILPPFVLLAANAIVMGAAALMERTSIGRATGGALS